MNNQTTEKRQLSPVLNWENLNYDVKTKNQGVRRILNDISGGIYPGELVAIMGSSGAGKTTLMNVLSGRVTGGKLYGDIKFNGERRDPHTFKRMLAFVEQDDLMHAQLTVEETLMASAQLRLPSEKYTLEDKRERVEAVMRQLRLSHVRDTKIGGYGARGVSGGERKRVSIGMELVTDPAILVLDEPSSGLDSSSAEMVVSLTKKMSRQRNLGTLMTIHQPSAEIVAQFDKLILLAQGKLVYMGPAYQALAYFQHLGYPSTNPNPANFYIDLMTIDFTSDEAMRTSEQRVQQLAELFVEFRAKDDGTKRLLLQKGQQELLTSAPTEYSNSSSNSNSTSVVGLTTSVSSASRTSSSPINQDITNEMASLSTFEAPPLNSWWQEMLTLLKRDWHVVTRNRSFIYGLAAQSIFTLIFFGFVFFQMGHDQSSVQNRVGLLFMLTVQFTFPIIIPVMTVIMTGRSVLLRERSAGSYRMTSFFIAKALSFFPLVYIPYSIMYTGIYFISHLQYDAGKYFIGFANMYATIFTALGFAFAIAMAVRSLEVAHIMAPVILVTLILFAGNLSNSAAITPVLRWIKYLCIYYYGYSAFMQNEFGGLEFTCSPGDSICYHTGEDVVNTYALSEQPIWLCIVINLALGIGFFTIAYGMLRWLAKPRYLWI